VLGKSFNQHDFIMSLLNMVAELEILKIIADFVIVLISITIPTYAIAVSFLGREYSKTLRRITTERERAEKELAEKIKSKEIPKLEDVERSVETFRKKERDLKNRVKPLSLFRILVLPNIFFGSSLTLNIVAVFFYPNYLELFFGLEIILIVSGLIIYGWALNGIQKVAQELEEEIM
jgi:hypothetical protein